MVKPIIAMEALQLGLKLTSNLPRHIAIIMDGNNRYAKKHGLPKGTGHIAGQRALSPIVQHCAQKGVQALTVFAFSSENWARPSDEVAQLLALLDAAIDDELAKLAQNNIRLRFIGHHAAFGQALCDKIADAQQKSADGDGMTLVIALGYGGRWEMADTARRLALLAQDGALDPHQIDETIFQKHTLLSDLPPLDMLIRTGGEKRLSNFLLWQAAYAELFFSDTLWPEFTPPMLDVLIDEFCRRERRFGA